MAEWVDAGRVKIIPKGEWDPNVQYEVDDIVTYHHYAYIARKDNIGVHPIDNEISEYWEQFGSAAQIATLLTTGLVKPDGITITIDEDGTIHGAGGTADSITFDNEGTGLEAENVQDAIVEQNESITDYFHMNEAEAKALTDEQIKALLGNKKHGIIEVIDKPYVADDVRSLEYIKEHGASGTLLSSDVASASALYEMTSYITTRKFTASVAVNAGGRASATVSIAQSGYTPISAMVSTNNDYIIPYIYGDLIDGNQIRVGCYNVGSAQYTPTLTIKVVYVQQ